MNFFQQFMKLSNVYFLIIMCMQMVKVISISNGQPAMLFPLLFVVFVSMVKDGYEDYVRHKADDKENNDKAEVYDATFNTFVERPWHSIQVGSIVRVKENKFFPADLLLLHSSEAEGICYVETKNLDGETNLKHKFAPKELNEQFPTEGSLFHYYA